MPKAIVIGSGIGGLAIALRLKAQGFNVEVFEKNSYVGGKIHAIQKDGYRFDLGPSLFTMPHFVDELFEMFGENPRDYFNYTQKNTVCHYFWNDNTVFRASADREEYMSELERLFGEPRERVLQFINRNQLKYDLTAPLFLHKSLHKLPTYLSFKTLKAIVQVYKLDLLRSLDRTAKSYFKHPKVIQLINRYATYNGSNPYKTPGIMSLIPHLEQHYGTYFPHGGMHEISQSLYRLAQRQGIGFHLNTNVERIICKQKRASGIEINGGQLVEASLIVSNMDVHPTYRHLLKDVKAPKKTLSQERSSSALIFYWGIQKSFDQLDLHNIFFSDDYAREFDCIFNKRTLTDDPTIYINISSKESKNDAPEGAENWFVMVNAPGDYGQDWEGIIEQARKNIMKKLGKILNVDLAQYICTEHVLDPRGIEKNTSSYRGALYGSASNTAFAAFLRHPNFNQRIKNLYHCGGSVHPGGGIPLCLLSAKIVSEIATRDFNS